jgi:hypothetical protein
MKCIRFVSLVLAAAAVPLAVVATLGGCGSTPCQDYCQTFVDKTQNCGLGGPSGDLVVEECVDQINDSEAQCTKLNTQINALDCTQFKAIICEQVGDQTMYNCGD